MSTPPIYSRLNKAKKEQPPKRPPVVPRRVNTLPSQSRIEHDFSPQLTSRQDSDSDLSSSSGENMDTLLEQLAVARHSRSLELASPDEDAEDTYTCMDGMLDNVPEPSRQSVERVDSDDEDRYVITSFKRLTVSTPPLPEVVEGSLPRPSSIPDVVPIPPKELKSPKATIPATDIDNNIYENSKTVVTDSTAPPKAVPAAAPRRARTVMARTTRTTAPPIPSARKLPKSDIDYQDDEDAYNNFLGEFGIGVSMKPVHDKSTNKSKSNATPRLKMGQSPSVDMPLPPTPVSKKYKQPLPAPPTGKSIITAAQSSSRSSAPAVSATLHISIPMADGESDSSLAGSSTLSQGAISPAQEGTTGRYVSTSN